MDPLEEIRALFSSDGTTEYFGEAVTQAEHMRQAGWLAEADGAGDTLIAAALLHDVGHFHGLLTGHDLLRGTDNHHSETGATWLARWFPASVTEPVRLHVAAKRYLCFLEPGYRAALSPASQHSLSVQGGPMDEAQAAVFSAQIYAADAIALRRWDDEAKDPQVEAPELEHFRPLLERLARLD